MPNEYRYEVSDGAIGHYTITGYFTDPLAAYRAFEAAHGDFARGCALVYRLDGDDEIYAVDENCGISPMAGRVNDDNPDYEKLWTLAHARADKEQNRADRYWAYLSTDARAALSGVLAKVCKTWADGHREVQDLFKEHMKKVKQSGRGPLGCADLLGADVQPEMKP